MEHEFRKALSHAAARVVGWRFARPIARAVLTATGLVLLAFVGRTAVAGALGGAAPSAATAASGAPVTAAASPAASIVTPPSAAQARPQALTAPPAADARPQVLTAPPAADARPQVLTAPPAADAPSNPQGSPAEGIPSRRPASPSDPVVLNSATESDLRRLPGIGAKRAEAILTLRARMGRFRAIEDLLKVKGIGRATLKRFRAMLRLDPPASDAGTTSPGP